MNSFLREFVRRRDSDDVVTNAKNTLTHAPASSKTLGGLPKPEGGLDFLIESKASMRDVHKHFRSEVQKYNGSHAVLRAEVKRRFKGDPVPS